MSNASVDQEERHLSKAPQGIVAVAATRAAQEVQAAMMIARQNPRDENEALAKIKRACQRLALAEKATYLYSKGGQDITGPSIRLAEVMAQCWGNIDFGFTELESGNGTSVVQSFCWDLETNSRQTRTFHVPHVRYTKNGGMVPLSDPREVYELMANQAARRTRACILGVIPGDIQEEAVIECEKTLKSGGKEPLQDRIRKMVVAFSLLGVKQEMIEFRLDHPAEQTTVTELQNLISIYNAIRDGQGDIKEYFPQPNAEGQKSESVAASLSAKAALEAAKANGKKPEVIQADPIAAIRQRILACNTEEDIAAISEQLSGDPDLRPEQFDEINTICEGRIELLKRKKSR